MTRAPWNDDDVQTIRASVATMNDTAIAKVLGWPTWRVHHVRRRFDIPAHHAEYWPEGALDHIHARYVLAGEPSPVVASELKVFGLDVTPSTLRRKARRMGWRRDPSLEERNRNLANARNGEARRARNAVGEKSPPRPRIQTRALPGPKLALHNAPVNWSKAPEDMRPLEERILSALRERPLSVMALASVIGAKEHAVDVQLAAMAHAGGVEAGPAGDCGRRNRLWRAAA